MLNLLFYGFELLITWVVPLKPTLEHTSPLKVGETILILTSSASKVEHSLIPTWKDVIVKIEVVIPDTTSFDPIVIVP